VVSRFFRSPISHLALLAFVGLLAYSNTFQASFHFDDYSNIVENPIIKDLSYFKEPSGARNFKHYDLFKSRYIGCLSFALNYMVHGLDVAGYHVVNMAVHLINSLLVYSLVMLTFRTPCLKGSLLGENSRHIALLSGLLFVSHPLQTQAVTYIVQRFASLATLFYLAAHVFYVRSRTSDRSAPRSFFYALTIISAVLAVKTKEIAVTLPFTVTICEFLFFRGPVKRRLLGLVPIFFVILIIPLSLAGMDRPFGEIIGAAKEFSRVDTEVSRWDYLLTEFRAVVTYSRLLVLPVNQNLDYNYPVYGSFFEPAVFLSFVFLLAAAGLGFILLHRSGRRPELRIASFGVFWFFIALVPESSVLPIVDVIFEHRVYLPSVGAIIVFSTLLFVVFSGSGKKLANASVMAVMVVAVFAGMAYKRNALWKDDISLWGDTAGKSAKGRPFNNLGLAYKERNRLNDAIRAYKEALRYEPTYTEASVNLAIAYWEMGRKEETVSELLRAIRIEPTSEAYYNLGAAYMKLDKPETALGYLRQAIVMDKSSAASYNALGVAYQRLGKTRKPINVLREGAWMLPGYPDLYYNLGRAHLEAGDRESAYGLPRF
jgi:tetratricopeptide (TPR) repeat protein